jgi:hypothetical protein
MQGDLDPEVAGILPFLSCSLFLTVRKRVLNLLKPSLIYMLLSLSLSPLHPPPSPPPAASLKKLDQVVLW